MNFANTTFDWDAGNTLKCQKHGLTIDVIEALFADDPRVVLDARHSQIETRMIAIGLTRGGRMIFVGFTMRERDGQQRIRPITARFMREKEIKRYAETSATV